MSGDARVTKTMTIEDATGKVVYDSEAPDPLRPARPPSVDALDRAAAEHDAGIAALEIEARMKVAGLEILRRAATLIISGALPVPPGLVSLGVDAAGELARAAIDAASRR